MVQPSLLLFFAAFAGTAKGMDLYVRDRYHNAVGEPCGACTEGDGCYLRSRSFFLRDSCINRSDAKSSFFSELEDGLVCRQDQPAACDAASAFDAASADDCKQTWTAGECTDSERVTKLAGWCEEAAAATGEYFVPLLAFREYETVAACDTADYSQLLLPNDGGTCVGMTYAAGDGTLVAGSRQGWCEGGTFQAMRYATPDCTGEGQSSNLHGSTDACPAEALRPFMYTEDCAAPKVHCKPSPFLSVTAASNAIKAAGADERGTGVSDGAETGGEDAGAKTGMIAGLVVGGVALLAVVGAGLAARRKRRAARDRGINEAKGDNEGGFEVDGDHLRHNGTDEESIPPPPPMEMGAEDMEVDVVEGGDSADSDGSVPPPPEEAPAKTGRNWGRFGRK